jgi:glycosyltransferase involved in cell wall biosynthesis/SAM-dependent methyltransferase
LTLDRLHLVIPGPLDQRTGGYIYDRRMAEELRAMGWSVTVHSLPPGLYPGPGDEGTAALAAVLDALPDGATVLLDGLAMGGHPTPLEQHRDRLGLLSLVHHPLADETGLQEEDRQELARLERRALATCRGVLTTSPFTASILERDYGVDPARLRAIPPGLDPAEPAVGPPPGAPPLLLCVASVTPRKGHDILIQALARLSHLPWTCVCAGSLERDRPWARRVLEQVEGAALAGRVHFPGEVEPEELDRLYHGASMFVLASHHEGYGMVLTEALSRGLPVVSTTGGAIPGSVPDGVGQLVAPGDVEAMARVLAGLLGPGEGQEEEAAEAARSRWAHAARAHAGAVPGWAARAAELGRAVDALRSLAPPSPAGALPEGAAFEEEWLTLREPVDHRSRGEALLPLLRDAWSRGGWSRVLDLGSGTGSNLRYLAPRLPAPQHWTLLDHDPTLLARATPPSDGVELVRIRGDLADVGLDEVAGADLVTASALLDLVSEAWLQRLVERCRTAGCGVLLALTYDGRVQWAVPGPPELLAMDLFVQEAVNRHQRRDKGIGGALGPTAGARAAQLFREAGFRVHGVDTPWELGPADGALTASLVEGWEEAACQEHPEEEQAIRRWGRDRRASALAGDLGVTVGHVDLLALPPETL